MKEKYYALDKHNMENLGKTTPWEKCSEAEYLELHMEFSVN